jgi:D-alanine transaminase
MSFAYLNGEYCSLETARISPLDRGFLFGDGVYEVIGFYQGKGVGVAGHLQRLRNSLAAIEIPAPLSDDEWLQIFEKLLPDTEHDYKIYLQITRGAAAQRDFVYPQNTKPTVFAYSSKFTRGRLNKGCKAITLEDIRWRDCYIKSINLLPSVMSTEIAKRHDCEEAILFRNDEVTEGASSNVFVVKDGTVLTTPATPRILNGITRQIVLDILVENNIPHAEVNIPLATLQSADEIWITSSTREIAPVLELDGNAVGNGELGKLWQLVSDAYLEKALTGV